jgi:hypothetical protein
MFRPEAVYDASASAYVHHGERTGCASTTTTASVITVPSARIVQRRAQTCAERPFRLRGARRERP